MLAIKKEVFDCFVTIATATLDSPSSFSFEDYPWLKEPPFADTKGRS